MAYHNNIKSYVYQNLSNNCFFNHLSKAFFLTRFTAIFHFLYTIHSIFCLFCCLMAYQPS